MASLPENRILFVCLGNICRSPMAHGLMRAKLQQHGLSHVSLDSAGTSGWHEGEAPDERAQAKMAEKGHPIDDLRARTFVAEDFRTFDRIFVMDSSNYRNVVALAPDDQSHEKVDWMLNLSRPGANQAVPDPYYGGEEGFENVYQLLDTACDALIKQYTQQP